jgi:hypothetical protein
MRPPASADTTRTEFNSLNDGMVGARERFVCLKGLISSLNSSQECS